MRGLMKIIKEKLTEGEALVLVSVTASSGAVPRGAGSRMLVSAQGRIYGTIGGGAVEYRSEKIAAEVLKEQSSKEHDFSLSRADVENLGMICGGDVSVFFHYIPAGDSSLIALADRFEEAFQNSQDLWLISELNEGGRLSLVDRDCAEYAPYLSRQPRRIKDGSRDIYVEQVCSSDRVYIFGCGHVSQELEPLLSHVGFRCTVMDDRPEFARPELFPSADSVKLIDFNKVSDYINIKEQDFVVIMTRGHAFDTVVQAQVLPCHPAYVGVIGGRHKAAGVRKVLKEEYGISEGDLNQVITPIGTEILAETPAEIAISIAGQMIYYRAKLTGK